MKTDPLRRHMAAEFLGTFSLVLVGCGAIVVNAQTGALGHVGVALCFGLVVMVMVGAIGHISGAHINPAVTLAFTLTGHLPRRTAAAYLAAQVGGAIMAAAVLRGLFGDLATLGTAQPAGPVLQSLGLEFLMTAALMFVIMAVATDEKAQGQLAAILIGATVAVNALWGGPISGAALNPARAFGPALISGLWAHQWMYWVGPLLGAVVGALAYNAIRSPAE